MITSFLAAFVFTTSFFAMMWLYDMLTAAFYFWMHDREVRAYERMIIKTEKLIAREKEFQAEINKLINQYMVVKIKVDKPDEQA